MAEAPLSINLTNHFLIAMPGMADDTFARSVVYVCEHSQRGALGLIINKPGDINMADLFHKVDLPLARAELGVQPVFHGGPVQTERGFVLHDPVVAEGLLPDESIYAATLTVPGGLEMTTSKDVLEALSSGGGPRRVLITLGVAGTCLGFLASWIFNPNAGYIVVLTMVAQYLVYETFHYCCHVHENWFVRNMPFINTIRRHHTAHHNMGIMMKYNMNLTFPIADWYMGSSDLRRGLFGHLFNGYSEEYVKEELKPVIARFRNDHSRVTLDGPLLTEQEAAVLRAP